MHPFTERFRDDVVRLPLNRAAGVTRDDNAKDFGIHVGTLDKWLRQARATDGERPGVSKSENDELRKLRKRNNLLEQEDEVLRRARAYMCQPHVREGLYPLVSEFAADGIAVTS